MFGAIRKTETVKALSRSPSYDLNQIFITALPLRYHSPAQRLAFKLCHPQPPLPLSSRASERRPMALSRARSHAEEALQEEDMSCGCSSRGSDRPYGLQQSLTGADKAAVNVVDL